MFCTLFERVLYLNKFFVHLDFGGQKRTKPIFG